VLCCTHLPPCFVQEEWPDDTSAVAQIKSDFSSDPAIGDRRQELVFIGQVGVLGGGARV
jgi:hypothetical protein